MNKKISIIVSLLAGCIALAVIFTSIKINTILEKFEHANLTLIFAYLVVVTLIMITLSWRWQIIIKSQKHKEVSLWHLFWYKVVGYGVSYVTPTAKIGGEPVRAGLLARHQIDFTAALSTVVIDKTIELTSSGLFFVIGIPIILLQFALPQSTTWLLIVVSVIILSLVFSFYYQMLNGRDFFGQVFKFFRLHKTKKGKAWAYKLKKFENLVIKFYHDDKEFFYGTMAISLLSWMLMFAEYELALMIFGYEGTLLQIFLIFSFVGAAYIIPIPMALGSLEASQLSVFSLMKLSTSAGVAMSFLIRLKDILWTVTGFIALGIYGLRIKETISQAGSLGKEVDFLKAGGKK